MSALTQETLMKDLALATLERRMLEEIERRIRIPCRNPWIPQRFSAFKTTGTGAPATSGIPRGPLAHANISMKLNRGK
jgi:hypothetical protein